MTILRSRVPPAAAGQTLGGWLARRFTYLEAAGWCAHVAAGRVRCNGVQADPGQVLAAGDLVEFTPEEARPTPSTVPVAIVLEDADFVVVDKPAHLVSHRRSAFAHNAFVPALEARLGCELEPVHRLDRETSGLLLLARNRFAAGALQRQFEDGAVRKSYVALVCGLVGADEFTIDAPLGRDRTSSVRDRRAVVAATDPGARAAVTTVRVRARFAGHTAVALAPRTGRTHQIRVHLLAAGHPLLGDKLYGRSDEEYRRWVGHLRRGGDPRDRLRLMLHASELSFAHPRSGAPVGLCSPLPADMLEVIAGLARGERPAD